MKVFSCLSQKGGAGKSTLAVSLACAAHLAGKKTLLVDMDVQGSTTDWNHARPARGPLTGLTVTEQHRALKRERFLEVAREYEIVILDGPPALGEVTQAAAIYSDVVILPIRTGGFSLWASHKTLELIRVADEVRGTLGLDPVRRAFVVNEARPRETMTKRTLAAIEASGGELAGTINHFTAFEQTQEQGDTVLRYDCPAAFQIRRLCRTLGLPHAFGEASRQATRRAS